VFFEPDQPDLTFTPWSELDDAWENLIEDLDDLRVPLIDVDPE
jgi:hypothetical protein